MQCILSLSQLSTVISTPCVINIINRLVANRTQNNVLLDADYTARLTDWGLVSSVAATSEASAYLRSSTMRSGSLRWIVPEQVLCDSKERFRKTKKSDIYSFGNIALQARPHGTNVLAISDPPAGFIRKTTMVRNL